MMGLRASGLAAQGSVLPLPARDRATGTTTGTFTPQPITCSIGANPYLSQEHLFGCQPDPECGGRLGSRRRGSLWVGEEQERGHCQCSPFSIHGKVYVCEATSLGISPQPASLAGGGKGTYLFNLKDSLRHSPRDGLSVSWNGLAPKADLVTDARRQLIRVAAKCMNLAFRVG